ncbi:hypothetical protein CI109_103814 [Kwoniella shandongensis]|uniref:Uncharacterized protein n=1 Tax=Kwoniella shandongensis TaxID=1734106 RepID=A0A5M6C7Q2_9TREE|nr:uncharacterized protein CI109_000492 [Kwoniella shandongensis]KAA5530921.1 hypothetical protein CI109_000492 [Kwoniella shandongensis]
MSSSSPMGVGLISTFLVETTSKWSCERVWDGVDFTPCFKERYMQNYPLLLVALSLIIILISTLHSYLSKSSAKGLVTPETLISPSEPSDLAKLESDVIVDAVASNLLPPQPATSTAKVGEKLADGEAEEVIVTWKKDQGGAVKKWRHVKLWVGLLGGLAWLGLEIAKAVKEGSWKDVIFPAWLTLLAASPDAPVTPLLTAHIIPALLLFRSAIILPHTSGLQIASSVYEIVYWIALISIPYYETLDRLLIGGHSRGGGSSGSYGEKLPKHYEEPASPFARATYAFLLPFLIKHYFTPVTLKDIPAIREDDSAASSTGEFRAFQAKKDAAYLKKHNQRRNKNLGLDLLRHFAPEIATQSAWAVLFICLQYLPPTGLRLLLQYVNDRETSEQPVHVAVLYVGMMVVGQCVGVVAMGQSLYLGRRVCIKLRAIIISQVFAKALRRRDLSGQVKKTVVDKNGKTVEAADATASEGKIANLVSVDAFTVAEICAYIYYLVSCPFAIIVNSLLLYSTLGTAAFAGIAVLILLMPLQGVIGRLYTITQKRFMSATDARLESITEVIAHIKLIKFNAWEGKFLDRMGDTRSHELYVLAQRFAVSTLFQVFFYAAPVLVTGVAFGVHSIVLHQPLTADRAFASLILFNMLKDPLALFQDTLTRLLQAYTSCSRIQSYLDEPDTLKYRQLSRPGPNDPSIGFKGAYLGYSFPEESHADEGDPFGLGELNLSFPVGDLSIICGPVGSGKTTLVLGLLGETILLRGKIFMPDDHANRDICPIDPSTGLSDTVAYCAQTPWLIGASIKENIVFGSDWDQTRYDKVVDACALRRDFEIFELGDDTEVGEKGTTCSGGQKARIALARAFYSPAKTIVLDDVLSAVDAQTARHIYDHVLQGPLTKGRTVIMVTHQVNLVAPAAGYIVMLDNGRVTASGSPAELSSSGNLELTEEDNSGSTTASTSTTLTPTGDNIESQLDGDESEALEAQKKIDADKAAKTTEEAKLAKQLVAAETSGQGTVGIATYLLYLKSMGGLFFWIAIISAFFGSHTLQVVNNAWIKEWANSNGNSASSIVETARHAVYVDSRAGHSTMYYIGIYWGLSAVYILAVAARVGITFVGALTASKSLYKKLLKRILGAKMRFFDSTPSGRIMNRLSKDMSSIDQETGEILMYFVNNCLAAAAVLVVISIATPPFLLAVVVIVLLYWIVGTLYVTTNREIKRIDSVTRSPIFISFSEVLVGMSTIRSYGDSARFMRKLFHELDQNTRCFWYLWQMNRVLNNWSNFVGALVTIFAAVFALRNRDMDAGAVGLPITYALTFTEYVLWVVRMYAATEMSMNSVERVGEYLDLDVEEEEHEKGIEPPAYWPTRDGSVVVENLTCRYAPQLDPVLKNVSFTIAPKEKIGICGRTGSGKSTLALSFFRFLFQESGSITIDGFDIGKLSLTALRSRLTILPQEAQLFSGTIRDNLDPFDQHEDADIWEALAQCGLVAKSRNPSRAASRAQSRVDLAAIRNEDDNDESIKKSTMVKKSSSTTKLGDKKLVAFEEDGLDGVEGEVEERVMIRSLEEKVAVGGKNFSQGQRQLLALARGLLKLRSSSFLIMDESTANLDHATDATIQNVLRTGLADIQMVVIAHRLMTVCGLDKILVLDHGEVIEFGTPFELMQKEGGSFRDLCKQSGEEAQLWELAKSVHEEKERAAGTK